MVFITKKQVQPLERTRTGAGYQVRLATCLSFLLSWSQPIYFGIPWYNNLENANQVLSEFIQHCYDTRVKLYIARDAMVAAQTHWPHLQGNLHRAWNVLKSWRMERKVSSRTPIPYVLLQGLVLKCLDMGLSRGRWSGHYIIMSVLLRVGFYGLLRAGEIYALRKRHIMVVTTTNGSKVVILAVEDPKTKHVFGRSQFVLIRDEATIKWVEWLISGLHLNTKLWPGDGNSFRRLLKSVLCAWELPESLVGPGGLRAGGASYMLLEGIDVLAIQHQGRWANTRSLSVYLQESMSFMVMSQLGSTMQARIVKLVSTYEYLWLEPFPFACKKVVKRRKRCQ